ncbi:MAG: nitroreductase family protein [Tissierellia bacterium]|nr:nitroreductase family protein [Tissierellia bacterium]
MNLDLYLKQRRTYRSFFEDKKIDKEDALKIIESQKYASRAANKQMLKYLVVLDEDLVNKITDNCNWAGLIKNDKGRPQKGHRPVMYIVVLKDQMDKSPMTDVDIGLSISNMTLKAWDLGIGSCIIASVNRKEVRNLLDIPLKQDIHTVIAFGYPDHKSEIVEKDTERPIYLRDDQGDYKVERVPTERLFKFYE